MRHNNVPPYEIISYSINPPVGENRFGAKPIVASNYQIRPDSPWNKEFWGRTAQEAIGRAKMAVDNWSSGLT